MTARAFVIVAMLALAVVGCSQPVDQSPLARGKSLSSEGKFDLAIEVLTEAIAKNPLDAEAYLYRGQAYMAQGREHASQAIADYNEAVRLSPSNCEGYYHRAYAYKAIGDREKAVADETKAHQLDLNYDRVNRLYTKSDQESRWAIERALATAGAPAADDKDSTGSLDDPTETASSPDKTPMTKSSATGSGRTKPSAAGSVSTAPQLRDAYGLPLSAPRSGSVTEELFGGSNKSDDLDSEGINTARRYRSLGAARRRAPPADWQAGAPQPPTAPTSPPPAATKPSPVGTLPFGNPYQPRGGSSPYAPTGPRSTGLRGDPTLRDVPRYDRRTDPNAVPIQPGLQTPPADLR